ncbi:MAG: hypothetical protein LAO78_26530 [Acidobacteriia bacterium]|nr:hypothetical protein [Terriglobia bacterium]
MASQTAEISELQEAVNTEANDLTVKQGWGAFFMAVIEAVCVFYVSAGKLGLIVASTSLAASGWATFLHRDVFRIPVLAMASIGAVLNLFLLWRAHALRNAPAAAWRRRPLSRRERWRTGRVIALSLATLTITTAEVWIHHVLHGATH